MKRIFLFYLPNILWFLFALGLFAYALITDLTLTWTLFYFYCFLLLVNSLSLIISLKTLKFQTLTTQPIDAEHGQIIRLALTRRQRILVPLIRASLNDIQGQPLVSQPQTMIFQCQVFLDFDGSHLKRGHYESSSITLYRYDFFKMLRRQVTYAYPFSLDILPHHEEAKALLLMNFLISQHFLSLTQSTQTGYDFLKIRAFQNGDRMNTLDWNHTLKLQELMTKIYEYEPEDGLRFVFTAGDDTHFETMLALYYTMYRLFNDLARTEWMIIDDNAQIHQPENQDFVSLSPLKGPISDSFHSGTARMSSIVFTTAASLSAIQPQKDVALVHLNAYGMLVFASVKTGEVTLQ